jgi:MOSC domain-containing protein YiiM
VKPGTRICLGSTTRIEITRDAAPCKTIAHCFSDRDFMRVSEKTHPGWSRAYAKVLAPGTVQVGDPVVIERD